MQGRNRYEGAVETAKIVSCNVAEEGGAEDGDWRRVSKQTVKDCLFGDEVGH